MIREATVSPYFNQAMGCQSSKGDEVSIPIGKFGGSLTRLLLGAVTLVGHLEFLPKPQLVNDVA